MAGATLIMALLTRFPVLVWAGAALLGWIAGELIMEDSVSRPFFDALGASYGLAHKPLELGMQVACAALVMLLGLAPAAAAQSWSGRRPGEESRPAE